MLFSRVVVAIVFIPLLLLAVVLGGPLLLAVVAAGTAVACIELSSMFHNRRLLVPPWLTALVGLAFVWPAYNGQSVWPWLAGVLALGLVWLVVARGIPDRMKALVLSISGGAYIGALASVVLLIAQLPNGVGWNLLALLATWAADTGGYAFGQRFGRHPFAPSVSPRKTWEGVAGSLLVAVLPVAVLTPFLPISLLHVVPFGLALGISAVVGDLLESLAKRQAGVKDSSKLLAGHGGFLDRMDSLLLVLPVVYGYAVLIA